MRITKEQRKIVKAFTCERLRKSEKNKEVIDRFTSRRGESLVGYLLENGWREDQEGSTAYYLIKAPDGEAALFFSLKCGSLFEPMDEDELLSAVERDRNLKRALMEAIRGEDQEEGRRLLEMIRSRNVDPALIKRRLAWRIDQKCDILDSVEEDKQKEPNRRIVRVNHTYSGVELVHFCVDDRIRPLWQMYGIERPFGEVMFWQHIVRKICNMQRLAGCKYAYLFAADLSVDESLIRYYESLEFVQSEDLATNKPVYDLCCRFMYQPVNELPLKRSRYFRNFNPDMRGVR